MDKPDSQLWFAEARLPEGWAQDVRVTVSDGRIARVEAGVKASGRTPRRRLAGHAQPAQPCFQRAMAGLTEQKAIDALKQRNGSAQEDSFWTWREVMYRYVDRLTPDDVEAIAALAYMEMLEGGFTRAGEFHYLHHDADGRRL
ncbi:MAG: hypothetical protein WDN06_11985 [Asticcacaulis sp.]